MSASRPIRPALAGFVAVAFLHLGIGMEARAGSTVADAQVPPGVHDVHPFHSTFSTGDQKEGMAAFIDKRKPNWKHR